MSNLIQATIKICGVKPLLWNAFGPNAIPLQKQERAGVAGNNPEEWKRTVLHTPEGQLYLRPDYIFSCFRGAAKHTKRGRGSVQRYIQATLQVQDNEILIDRFIPDFNGELPKTLPADPSLPVYLSIMGVRNPATRAMNVRYRVAASPGWIAEFHLLWDRTIVSRGEMETIALDAGRLVGLGDGRNIGFGRFDINAFEVENAQSSTTQ